MPSFARICQETLFLTYNSHLKSFFGLSIYAVVRAYWFACGYRIFKPRLLAPIMDHIAAASEELFTAQDFSDEPSAYEILEVVQNAPTRLGRTHELRVSSTSLDQAASAVEAPDVNGEPSLTLVKVRLDETEVTSRFCTTSTDFIELSRAFKIHPYTLYLISRNIVGYQQIGPSDKQGPTPYRTYYATYYVNYEALKIVWAYNPRTQTSRGIMLQKATPGGTSAYSKFCEKLTAFCSDEMVHHPLFPLFIAIVSTTEFFDQRVLAQERLIGQTEMQLPYSPWSLDTSVNPIATKDAQKLSWYSRKMAAAVIELEDVLRHINMVTRMADAFNQPDTLTPGNESIIECLGLMLAHLHYTNTFATFLRERAKNQLGVIFTLITRGDTLATIELARTTRADGFSIKVIAIMTMAFLPATAIATILSLPLLNWDASPVASQSFWIFWAISIPTTIAILFVWWASTLGWSNLVRRMRGRYPATPEVDAMELESDWGDERASYTRRSTA